MMMDEDVENLKSIVYSLQNNPSITQVTLKDVEDSYKTGKPIYFKKSDQFF